MSDETGVHQHRTLADKLSHLYAATLPASRGNRPYTDREVAAAICAQGAEISASYLNLLRTGKKTNPTMRHLEGLARFFGVPPAYFFDEDLASRVDDELDRLAGMRDLRAALDAPEVQAVALKARGLSDASLRRLGDIIDHVRELEQANRKPEQ
ncbi:helix-turn-helix transcriptional regulator [Actinoplanes sp. TFC3]|uniref:helix-turn-helix domain-containing protein n=1 Tax=Actinoplanes sp. TFC3 TaxID=1710355 RepID=UPI0008306494|nr:helix-turn-helix transcriptional regulator [Actinoplanes sp. TFC3]